MKEGHIKTARVLLTESRSNISVEICPSFTLSNILRVSAEAANTKGRSPLHEFARFIFFQWEIKRVDLTYFIGLGLLKKMLSRCLSCFLNACQSTTLTGLMEMVNWDLHKNLSEGYFISQVTLHCYWHTLKATGTCAGLWWDKNPVWSLSVCLS